jgi:hypothetical protein
MKIFTIYHENIYNLARKYSGTRKSEFEMFLQEGNKEREGGLLVSRGRTKPDFLNRK